MSIACSAVNWAISVIGCPVDIGAKIIEELHHRCVALISCDEGWSGAECSEGGRGSGGGGGGHGGGQGTCTQGTGTQAPSWG